MRFIPGWKDILKTLWIFILVGGWSALARSIMESEIPWHIAKNTPLILSMVACLFLIFPMVAVAGIHHFFWGKRAEWLPAWMPTGASWWEAVWIYGAVIIGLFTPILLGFLGIAAWNQVFQFAVIDLRTTAEAMGRNDVFIGALVAAWFYIVALTMKLQRWSNRPR